MLKLVLKGFFVALLSLAATGVYAGDYVRQKWFDFPDLGTAPRVGPGGCAQWISHWACHGCPFNCTCGNTQSCLIPTPGKTELLRREVWFVASGPDSGEDAVRKAVEGYALGCTAAATNACYAAAAAAAAGTPAAQIAACTGALAPTFQGCIAAISAPGVVGSIVKQLSITIDTSQTHWSPL